MVAKETIINVKIAIMLNLGNANVGNVIQAALFTVEKSIIL